MKFKISGVLIMVILFVQSSLVLFAQDTQFVTLEKKYENAPLKEFLIDIEENSQYIFYYKEEWIEGITITGEYKVNTIQQMLVQLLSANNLELIVRGNNIIILRSQKISNSEYATDNISDQTIIIGELNENSPSSKVSLSGYVLDGATGEKLYGVNIIDEKLLTGVTTNKYGYYSIDMNPGLHELIFKYIGFETLKKSFLIRGTGTYDIEIFQNTLQLNEVVINEDNPDQNVNGTEISTIKLDIKTIENIPAFLGEVDMVRSLLLLPGVTTVGEGSAGFNVRGEGADKNLILFDDAPIYNPSHLFGFFSNFNSDVVNDVTLYKGGIPPQYGGRTSSVLDIKSKDANNEKFGASGGVGLVSSRLALEIPLIKGKSGLLLGGRSSYSDWMLKKVNDYDIRNSSAKFYDVNGKWTLNIGEKDRLSISGYLSSDEFKFASDTSYNWQTKNATLKWTHILNKRLSTELTTTTANYNYNVDGLLPPFTYRISAGIAKNTLKLDLVYIPNVSHQISFGGEYGTYNINPGERKVDGPSIIPLKLEEERANESAIFIQDNFKVTNKLSIVGGLRYSFYNNIGPGYVLNYKENEPKSNLTVIDTLFYNKKGNIKTYDGLEPRLSAKYNLSASSSLKLSYNRLYQYIRIVSNTTAMTPVDIWKSSDKYIAPQISDQITLGYFRNFKDNNVETSAEVYYKWLNNALDYKNGAEIFLKENIEQQVVTGTGRAYGLEFFVKKKTGRLNGWISYAYSRTFKTIKGSSEEETINHGNPYPANYDKPHSLSVVVNYKITRRWSFNGNFTYSTGRPLTAPESQYNIGGIALAHFSERNQYRIPDYHRLDLSLTLDGNHKRKKILDGSWTLSIYNVYGRKNAYSVFFKDAYGAPPSAYKLSVLGTVFPSLTYNFKL